jgi:uncharacterized membrane protein YcgQ (UPF0703/DUF1980 family)
MKKILCAVIAGILFLAAGCVKQEANKNETDSQSNIVEIRERMFLGQVMDVYVNPYDYLGKIIKLEGIFLTQENEEPKEFYNLVVRYGPGGCCGVDGLVGFEVKWEDRARQFPEVGSWVEAVGVLKKDNTYLYMDLYQLNVLKKRGQEYVSQ